MVASLVLRCRAICYRILKMQQASLETVLTSTTDPDKSLSFREIEEIRQAHQFVFVCGLHRSGTTLLFRMLREHPSMSGFTNNQVATEWLSMEDEGQYLQAVYPPGLGYGGPGRFAFAPDAHLTEESELLTPENKAQLAVDWFPYWDLTKPFLLEKSPPNILMTRFLQSAFPNSAFVIIERHPVAVSFATEKWCPTGLDSLLNHWLVAHEIFEADRPHLRRVMTVKYEALISDPAAALRNIYSFLEVPPHGTTFEATTEHNRRYFERWNQMLANPETRTSIDECIAHHENRARAFGYSLQTLEIF
jgi:Sulfotransferase family